jgi:quercetin dioxygenase-like cupin family protein
MKKQIDFFPGSLFMLFVKGIHSMTDDKFKNLFDNVGWIDAQNYPEGTRMKIVHEEGEVKTFILKVPKGSVMKKHSHSHFEQHFLLEGEYVVDGKLCKKGTCQYYKPNESHGPYDVKNTSFILVVFYPGSSSD